MPCQTLLRRSRQGDTGQPYLSHFLGAATKDPPKTAHISRCLTEPSRIQEHCVHSSCTGPPTNVCLTLTGTKGHTPIYIGAC